MDIFAQNKAAKEQLDDLLKNQKITEDYYNKGIINIAYDYALNGYPEECLLMLLNCEEEFLANIVIDQNFKESDFYKKCLFILEILDFTGYTPYDLTATQKEGKA